MTPYLDGGLLLTLFVKARGTGTASRLLREIPAPAAINFLHQLQVENLLVGLQQSGERDLQVGGNEGQRLWRTYLAEGVFNLTPADWDTAFRNAITWNSHFSGRPPPPSILVHPALAFTGGATHFLSFGSRARSLAKAHGTTVLPERA